MLRSRRRRRRRGSGLLQCPLVVVWPWLETHSGAGARLNSLHSSAARPWPCPGWCSTAGTATAGELRHEVTPTGVHPCWTPFLNLVIWNNINQQMIGYLKKSCYLKQVHSQSTVAEFRIDNMTEQKADFSFPVSVSLNSILQSLLWCEEECLVAAPHAGLSAAAVSPPWPHTAQLPGPGGAVQLCSRAAPHLLMNINTTHQHSFSSSDMTTQANNAALFTMNQKQHITLWLASFAPMTMMVNSLDMTIPM